jgi:hypothetical protein
MLTSTKVNINQDLLITFLIDSNSDPDSFFYSANLFYNYEIVKTLTFSYVKV